MYTRSYYPDTQEKISLPENYVGTAFGTEECESQSDIKESEPALADSGAIEGGSFGRIFSLFKRLPKREFQAFGLDRLHIKDFKLGKEEILILAVAAFMLFSHEGDKELALMLLLLLFIN